MKIYESAVRKPVSTVLMFVGVMVFGLFSLMNLAVDQYPEIEIPQISVITFYPGANAADIETNITRILEDNLNTVSNLKKLTSKSQDNVSMIIVEFEYGSDLTEGANEIRDVVSRSQSQLPDDIDYPTIFKFSTSMIPVIMLAVTADESYPALKKILDDKFVNVLNRVDGVGAVTVMGAPEREVQVNVDPAKLEAYNLTVEQLGQIIAAENVNIPSGTIDIGNNTFNIKADGEFKLSDEMRKVVVSNAGGRTVMLSDVAEIRDTLEKATMDERANGQRSVRVMIQKQSGANTVDIVHEIQKRLPDIQASLPRDVKMETIFEGSQEITNAIGSLSETIMYAFIFVVLVVMAFLGRWRATLIICMTIPVSLICSFIYLFATGSTLNIIHLRHQRGVAVGHCHHARGRCRVPAADNGAGHGGYPLPRAGLDRDHRGLRFDYGSHFADPDDVRLPLETRGRRARLQGAGCHIQTHRPGARMARRRLCPLAELGGAPPPYHDLLDDGAFPGFAGARHAGADRILPAFG